MIGSHGRGSLRLPLVACTLLWGAVALTSGCAEVTGGDSVRQDLAQLRQDLNALTLGTHRNRGDSETVLSQLDRRTREQSAESTRRLAALSTRLETLANELSRVSARVEDISQRVEGLNQQLAARSAPPRPAPAPAAPAPAPAAPAPSPASPGPAPAPPAPAAPRASVGGPTPEEAYQAAYLDFSKGNYPLAISSFREFVRRYPDSQLADNAQYWIGESYFSLARSSASQGQADRVTQALEQAVQEFRKVTLNYPRGNKVPTAIYKEALALVELKQTKMAQARLQYLLDHFPQSEEAPLAKERLATLREAG